MRKYSRDQQLTVTLSYPAMHVPNAVLSKIIIQIRNFAVKLRAITGRELTILSPPTIFEAVS